MEPAVGCSGNETSECICVVVCKVGTASNIHIYLSGTPGYVLGFMTGTRDNLGSALAIGDRLSYSDMAHVTEGNTK